MPRESAMTSTPTAALDADLQALENAVRMLDAVQSPTAKAHWTDAADTARRRLRSTFSRLQGRVEALEQERDAYRSALLEVASGRKPGAVNDEHWKMAATRFIERARRALRGDAPLSDFQRASIAQGRAPVEGI